MYTLKEVAAHCTIHSCWMVVNDKVYDLTDFLMIHPAGYEIMLEHAGTDATNAFFEKGHSLSAQNMLEKYFVGELVKVSPSVNQKIKFSCFKFFFNKLKGRSHENIIIICMYLKQFIECLREIFLNLCSILVRYSNQ